MCGIVGLWQHGREDVAPARFRRAVDALAHRGPDGEGTYHDEDLRLHLGHRRLAILDPTPAGAQPMSTEDGRHTIVYNGEVYDFLEVRRELTTHGHRFRTDTDTEVLLAAYRQWGEDMLRHLNGMWAFAIWDREERRLFAARDRFGVKPLLYRAMPNSFAFASELKAFAALPDADVELDAATLAFSPMAMETVGHTLLKGVRALPPGHLMVVEADGTTRMRRWWRTVDHLAPVASSYGEQVAGFRDLFEDACRLRLRADVPLGTSLSGGLDSSSVVAMVHRVGGQQGFTQDWQRVFSQGYAGTTQDEAVWAARVAGHLGIDVTWTDTTVEHELDALETSVMAFEGVHILPLGLWAHYRALREQGVVISIDGHGGDELLGGYPRFSDAMRARSLRAGRLSTWRSYADTTLGLRGDELDDAGRRLLLRADVRAAIDPGTTLAALRSAPLLRGARARLHPVLPMRAGGRGVLADGAALAERSVALAAHQSALRREARRLGPQGSMLYEAFHHSILPSILRNFDRVAMASGVEIRSPLLDWRLVTYAFGLPDTSRIGGGFTKRILRDATSGLLPDDVRLRRDKKGFAPPMLDWLSRGLGDRALEVVHDAEFLGRGFWDGAAIRDRVVAAHARKDWGALKGDWSFVQAELLQRGLERIAALGR
jgi:asparagine synthase (glutamine-hydrolysing)